jgi:porin
LRDFRRTGVRAGLALIALSATSLAGKAYADPAAPSASGAASLVLPALDPALASASFRAEAPASPQESGPFGVLSGAWQSPTVLGDIGGLRPALAKYGATLAILENVESFGNLTGGVQRGFELDGLTTVTLQVDTEKAFGLHGGLFNASGLQYWGGNLSEDNLHNIQLVSDIFAPVGVRLWELWYQQKFGDRVDVKIGEQSLDEEFIISPSSQFFINAASGWPPVPAENLPGGGPAYPLAGLGVRGRVQANDNITVLGGVFNGSPIPKNSPNTPLSNPYGVSFPLNTGVLAIAELQFAFPGAAAAAKPSPGDPLPGVFKIGAWWDSEPFDDPRYDSLGVPLASPSSNGAPFVHHGLFAIYGVADQTIWRASDDSARTLNLFIRPIFTPYQDRNLIDFSVNAGLALKGPFAGRDSDTFGLEVGVANISSDAAGADRDLSYYNFPEFSPVRSRETFLEASYQAQILPSWQLQPDIQYVINPGGGIVNPNAPTETIKNAWIVGIRTNITF